MVVPHNVFSEDKIKETMQIQQSDEREKRIKGIGYIRQSDERKDKEDISEQTQLTKIQQYCDLNNIELVAVFKDIDYSGYRISYLKRPGLMDAMEYAKNNNIGKFVIYNTSRLSRRKRDFDLIQESLMSIGVDICTSAVQLDFGSPTGRLVAGMLIGFDEFYSDNLSEITLASKKTNAEKGRWNGGPAPFGLVKKDEVFISDGENGEIVRQAFRMAMDGKGPFVVSRYLTERTGKVWSPRRARYLLTNPTYAAKQKSGGEFYDLNGFETLVDWHDFQYIQNTLFGKEKAWKGKKRQLLSSLLICPTCGGKMHSRRTTIKTARRYVCSKVNMSGGCKTADINGDNRTPVIDLSSLNNAVINCIDELAGKRFVRDEFIDGLSSGEDDKTNAIDTLRMEYNNLDKAKQKVFDDYYLNAKLSEEQFKILMSRYENRQKEIDDSLRRIPLPKSNKYGNYEDVLTHFSEAFSKISEDDQRTAVELLIEKIVPTNPAIIHYRWGETSKIPVKEIKNYRSPVYFY